MANSSEKLHGDFLGHFSAVALSPSPPSLGYLGIPNLQLVPFSPVKLQEASGTTFCLAAFLHILDQQMPECTFLLSWTLVLQILAFSLSATITFCLLFYPVLQAPNVPHFCLTLGLCVCSSALLQHIRTLSTYLVTILLSDVTSTIVSMKKPPLTFLARSNPLLQASGVPHLLPLSSNCHRYNFIFINVIIGFGLLSPIIL